MMDTSIYKSLPEAKILLDHIHKINPKYGIEIICFNRLFLIVFFQVKNSHLKGDVCKFKLCSEIIS